jgi:nitroreductase
MDIVEAVKTRKSIRGFKKDPVPRDVLREILEISCRAPSGSNSQPWEFAVAAGEALEKIKDGNVERYRAVGGDPYAGRKSSGDDADVYAKRSAEVMALVSDLIGMKRDDVEARRKWREQGVQYFGAPAAIFILVDRALPDVIPLIDIGIMIQTICLVALDFGLGTCIQGQGVLYPKIVAEHAGIPRSKRIIMSIAIGYPDWDFPANAIVTPREPLDSITTWRGFE